MSATADLSIIIVNWNTRELLAGCLAAIDRTVRAPGSLSIEVIVVDNASDDDSVAMVQAQFPWVRPLNNSENVGFAAANNRALREACGGVMCLLNPDTVAQPGVILKLWEIVRAHPSIGIAGAQLLNADGSHQMSVGVFPSLWSELPMANRLLRTVHRAFTVHTAAGETIVHSVDWVSGAALMVRRDVIDTIGLLDETFWLYTEETDWCYRARRAGWDVVLAPDAHVFHMARAASRQRFVTTMLHFYQSRVRFVYKHHGMHQATLIRSLLRLKAAIWRRNPEVSPLRSAYIDLSTGQITAAYQQLEEELAAPLSVLLAATWR